MRDTLAQLGVNVKLVYIVVQKNQPLRYFLFATFYCQFLRFFLETIPTGVKVPEQNIPPGVVCDLHVVHPAQKQFYLNSHTTIQVC